MASHQGMLTLTVTVVLLALPSLTHGETFNVRPTSTNTSCPTHTCHTLSEYAQDPGQYFKTSNLTLQFLPGNHTLNVKLFITSIHQLKLLGNITAVVPSRVLCSSYVGFGFSYILEMRIDGLAFVSCAEFNVVLDHEVTYYGLYLQTVETAEIIDCTFQDSYGSALGVVDSHVVLRGNNSFLNSCKLCSNGKCYFSAPNCYGGGVFAQVSNLSVIGSSSFTGNSAYHGGGVYAEFNSNVNITGKTYFINNSAYHGGGVYAEFNRNVNITGNTYFIN